MNIMFLLIGVSMLAALLFLILYVWAVKTGQFDDMYTPSVRILFDDDAVLVDDVDKQSNKNIQLADGSPRREARSIQNQ
jgi:cbb3-type cytochrome oxidase maturation protein